MRIVSQLEIRLRNEVSRMRDEAYVWEQKIGRAKTEAVRCTYAALAQQLRDDADMIERNLSREESD